VTNNIQTQASSKANPQCKKETTASDEGQGTKNSNTHVCLSITRIMNGTFNNRKRQHTGTKNIPIML